MNREELPRIRLKVATTAGINILCTALRKWKVSDWLPHIQEAFRQVREDQGEDEYSKKNFIRALRLKKGDFYIANSQIIGDVFEDNDEVHCEIDFSGQSKKQIKESKKSKKAQPKTQSKNRKSKDNIQPKIQIKKLEEKEIQSQIEVEQSKPNKKIKIEKKKESHKEPLQNQEQAVVQKKKKIQRAKEIKPKKQKTVVEKADKSKYSQKFVKVDLTKLKSLLVKNEKKIEPKIQSPQKSKRSSSQENS